MDRAGNQAVQRREPFEGGLIVGADHFRDFFQAVFVVARVDAFGGISQVELAEFHAGSFFQDRETDFLGRSRINRAFKHHRAACGQVRPDQARRVAQGFQVRHVGAVDRCRYRHDDHRARRQVGRVGAERQARIVEVAAEGFTGAIDAPLQLLHPARVDIEPEHVDMLGQCRRQRQTNVTETDN